MNLVPSNPVEGSQNNTNHHGTSSSDAQQLSLFDPDLRPSLPSPTPPRQADYPNLLRGRKGVKAKPKPQGFGRPLTEEELESEKKIFNNTPQVTRTSVHGYLRDWAEKYTTPTSSSGKVLRFLVERIRHTPSDPNYLKCWPKISIIAHETGLPIRTVLRAIAALIEQKLIGVKKGRRESTYTIFPGHVIERSTTNYRRCGDSLDMPDYRENGTPLVITRRGTEEIIGASAYDSKKMTPFQRGVAKHADIDMHKIQQRMPWIKHHLEVLKICEEDPVWRIGVNPEYSDLVEYVLRLHLAGRLGRSPAEVIENEVASRGMRSRLITSALRILEDKNCFAERALHYVHLFPHDTVESLNIDNFSFCKGKDLLRICTQRCEALTESFPLGYGINYQF